MNLEKNFGRHLGSYFLFTAPAWRRSFAMTAEIYACFILNISGHNLHEP